MIRFADPLWFGAVLLIALRLALLWRDHRRGRAAFAFSSLSLVASRRTARTATAWLPLFLETLALLSIVVALARPQRVTRIAASERLGIDIVVALDASGSMAAEDFTPRNRLEVAKELIGAFIQGRVNDRIGLVTFGSRAATRVPVTHDRRVTEAILDATVIGQHGNGTAIGHAVATAVNRLRDSKARSRVVILVTDGVNSAGSIDPRVSAQVAARAGIKVYTIGVGSEGDVPLPVQRQDPFTGEVRTEYVRIRGELDEATLQAIATETGGAYFRATDARALQQVLGRIDALERSRLNAPRREQIEELFVTPLVLGVALLLVALVAGETLWMKVAA